MYLSEPFSITLGIVIISVKSSISALMAEYMMRSWDRELRSIRPRGSNHRHIIIRIIIDCSNNDVSVSPWNMSSKFWNEKPLPNYKYVKRTAIGKSGNVLVGTAAQTKLCSMLRTCFCLNWDSHSEKVDARIHHNISSFWNSYWISSFLYRNWHRHRHSWRHKQLIVQSRQMHVLPFKIRRYVSNLKKRSVSRIMPLVYKLIVVNLQSTPCTKIALRFTY